MDVIGSKELEARGSPNPCVQFIKTIPSSGAVIGENNCWAGVRRGDGQPAQPEFDKVMGARTLVRAQRLAGAGLVPGLNSVDINLPSAAIATGSRCRGRSGPPPMARTPSVGS